MIKTFVLDTNVLLHSSQALNAFQDNNIAIPMAVIEELDKFKKSHDELGRNSRRVIRTLDSLRVQGRLLDGVSMKNLRNGSSGKLRIVSAGTASNRYWQKIEAFGWDTDKADNRILVAALQMQAELSEPVIFVSKDINLRLKADMLGLKVADFEQDKVEPERLFTGFQTIEATDEEINRFYRDKVLEKTNLQLAPNEFALLQSGSNAKHTALARYAGGNLLKALNIADDFHIGHIAPRNKEQRMALELLCDPSVRLVTLVGGAGTGKTLLALAAGLFEIFERKHYEKLLISRPIVPLGNDIGYLPGGKNDKLQSWMQPIFDNLEFLLEGSGRDSRSTPERQVSNLINKGTLQLEAITYIRGRSIPEHFVIIDEAQNLTPHEVKTIISRAGENTKMVLTGDPQQIDNPYLDASSNGLSVTVEQFKNEKIHGHVTLKKSERSELAALAAKLL
ncbi:MAG: PhoH family protein [Lentisphaerae bacterium]|nr:PhoH family protein [Lentisphaerota bacterium]